MNLLTTAFRQRRLSALITLSASLATLSLPAVGAISWNDIQFGGFISQGYLVNSGDNDYFGESSEGTFDFREYAANASYSKGSFRVGAQAFAQKLGDYGDDEIALDWATLDWQPTQWFGVRAGRVKTPRGLYNEALDVDAIRPFVLMPQSAYDARLRDFNASFDGAMLFGNVGLGRYGSIDYKAFYGDVPMKVSSGANDYFNNDAPFPNIAIGMDHAVGGTLFWNTPIAGLRTGYSFSTFKNFGADRLVVVGPFSAVLYRDTDHYDRHMISAEYMTGDWTFAIEAGNESAYYKIGAVGTVSTQAIDTSLDYGYVSASRRMGEKWEFGAYYSYSQETQMPIGFVFDLPVLTQHDYAVSAKYAFNERWIAKAEVHYLDGAGKIFTTPAKPQPYADRDTSWTLLALKTTYSF